MKTMVPFAGFKTFYIADLGLEFLHWPQQRLLKRRNAPQPLLRCAGKASMPKPGSGYSLGRFVGERNHHMDRPTPMPMSSLGNCKKL